MKLKDKLKLDKNKIKLILFCFIISLVVLFICSENSPIYPMNTWVDVNSFFTTAKSMLSGKVLYRDVVEQKGPLLYLIYILGLLINSKSYIGVFIVEIGFFTVFLYYMHKIMMLYLEKTYSNILLPIIASLICISHSFCHGGSAEEFVFPLMAIVLYHFLIFLKEKKISNKKLFLNGFAAGIVLLIKFTLLGPWFSFMMLIFFYYFFNKEYKNAFLYCVIFLSGMAIPFILTIIYFALNNGVYHFFNIYFYMNLFAYNTSKISIFMKIINAYTGMVGVLFSNGVTYILTFILIPLFINKYMKDKKDKIYMNIYILTTILFTFIGNIFFRYYLLILLPFMIFGLIYIIKFLEIKNNKEYKVFLVISLLISLIMSYWGANYRKLIFEPKENLIQYKFAEIMKKDPKGKSLINFHFLDNGFYYATDVMPVNKYFHQMNINHIDYPDNYEDHDNTVRNKLVRYVVIQMKTSMDFSNSSYELLLENYELVLQDREYQDEEMYEYALFRVKE